MKILLCLSLLLTVEATYRQSSYSGSMRLQNKLRARNQAPPLTLDSQLTRYAQTRSATVAAQGGLNHDPSNPYGENLAWFSETLSPDDAAQKSVQMWYDEGQRYNYNNPGFSGTTGHFTQVVWVASTTCGFGVTVASDGSTYVSCVYNPPGNYGGPRDYRANVLRPSRGSGGGGSGGSDAQGQTTATAPPPASGWGSGGWTSNPNQTDGGVLLHY